MSTPIEILREATRAVPAVRYALGVAGILAAVALVRGFGLDARTALLGTLGMLALMVVLVVFARLTKTAPSHFVTPILVLMWSMLVITVASAVLLFTSVFFDWPLAMSALISATSTAPSPEVSRVDEAGAAQATAREVAVAQSQLDAGDHAGAWATLAAWAAAHPGPEIEHAQALAAMRWLRAMHAPEGTTFTEQVKPLLPVLHRVAAGADAVLAADALAHIGWGHFLEWREANAAESAIGALYSQALAGDPSNPYAHAMSGHWILWRTGDVPAAAAHFEAALASGREAPWARQLALAAYLQRDAIREAVSTLIAMRRAGDSLAADERERIASRLYESSDSAVWARLAAAADPREHLAAFDWLTEGESFAAAGLLAWRRAQLSVAAGECARAKPYYDELIARELAIVSDDELRAELAACEPHA